MPEPLTSIAAAGFVYGASAELGRQVAEQHGPAVRKSLEDSAKQIGKVIDESMKTDPRKFGAKA
jgi:hypothetical protein